MQSSKTRLIIGLLVMLVSVVGILIKFDKMPGVRLDARTGRFELGAGGRGGGGDGGGDDSQGGVKEVSKSDDLRLSGLSSSAARRLAIVNNQTFAAGETARVLVRGEWSKVLCQEIRTNSVVVQIVGEGKPVELFLGEVSLGGPGEKVQPSPAKASHTAAPANQTARVETEAEKLKHTSPQTPTNAALPQLNETNRSAEIHADGPQLPSGA